MELGDQEQEAPLLERECMPLFSVDQMEFIGCSGATYMLKLLLVSRKFFSTKLNKKTNRLFQ
jgi:hypothetical protein